MADEIRVFDSISAAVANSAQPAPPPYAPVGENSTESSAPEDPKAQEPVSGPETPSPVPVGRKPSQRRTGAKTGAVTAQPGAAGAQVSAKGSE